MTGYKESKHVDTSSCQNCNKISYPSVRAFWKKLCARNKYWRLTSTLPLIPRAGPAREPKVLRAKRKIICSYDYGPEVVIYQWWINFGVVSSRRMSWKLSYWQSRSWEERLLHSSAMLMTEAFILSKDILSNRSWRHAWAYNCKHNGPRSRYVTE